ncbi:Uncharacterised protein [Acinetobacter baumannii]|uniref:hypothetical protein n=1 Tax=Acinetobacter baumannii TaxID=470 RepID=UPI000DE6830E|nr:hypothetical protein [Acinetobacter baumannii]EME4727110.1 hypothetical protein [Acinetobacter baumannii]MCA4384343.1 hypothetical protein [Acinetobacter baumannii]SSQ27666.1 Uncharacterised protein [Acinetobacter baumannii]
MTDLNKEREAFLNTFQYYKGRRDIIFSHEHELFMTRSNNPSEVAQKEISNMNSRWDAWLRCAKHRDAEQEKAKAQAVPDTHVILPIDVMKRTIGHIGLAMCHPNNYSYEEDIMAKDQEIIERAIDASESGAEQ